jgi:hypothetical protein
MGEAMTPKEVTMAMRTMDPTRSGQVDFHGFHGWWTGRSDMDKAVSLSCKAWATVDTDGDGTLDPAEFRAVLDHLGQADGLSDDDFSALMVELDEDGDGVVDREEFTAWFGNQVESGKTTLEDLTRQYEEHQALESEILDTPLDPELDPASSAGSRSEDAAATVDDQGSGSGGGADTGTGTANELKKKRKKQKKAPEDGGMVGLEVNPLAIQHQVDGASADDFHQLVEMPTTKKKKKKKKKKTQQPEDEKTNTKKTKKKKKELVVETPNPLGPNDESDGESDSDVTANPLVSDSTTGDEADLHEVET